MTTGDPSRIFADRTPDELIDLLLRSGNGAPMTLIDEILSRGDAIVPQLIAHLENQNTGASEDPDHYWMPLHAVKLLGELRAESALGALVDAIRRAVKNHDDWICEDLPHALSRLGPCALPRLREEVMEGALDRDSDQEYRRAIAAEAAARIAAEFPDVREEVLEFLKGLFVDGEEPELLGYVACDMLRLAGDDVRPFLLDAFDRGLIEDTVLDRDEIESARYDPAFSVIDPLAYYEDDMVETRQKDEEEGRRRADELHEKWHREMDLEFRRMDGAVRLPKDVHGSPKIGRNDSCMCGSGRKFKKCCGPAISAIPPKAVLHTDRYASSDYLALASAFDLLLVLENLTHLAMESKRFGALQSGVKIFGLLRSVAAESGKSERLLEAWLTTIEDEPEYGSMAEELRQELGRLK